MKNNRPRNLGFILIGVGLLLAAGGISKLTQPDMFRAKARITLDVSDCGCLIEDGAKHSCDLDSGFAIQMKAIQAETVLSNVVTRLDLNSVWGNKYYNGQKLRTAETIALLRSHVDVRLVSNTALADICATSEDPAEAALIANTVAAVCRDWRNDRGRRMVEAGIADLAKQREKINQQIKNSEGELERLRRALNIPSPEPGIGFLRTNFPAYSKAKTELDELKNFGRLIARKIKIEQEDLSLPHHDSRVVILERAVPSATPIRFYRQSGATLLLVGLAIFGWGVAIVRNSKACDS